MTLFFLFLLFTYSETPCADSKVHLLTTYLLTLSFSFLERDHVLIPIPTRNHNSSKGNPAPRPKRAFLSNHTVRLTAVTLFWLDRDVSLGTDWICAHRAPGNSAGLRRGRWTSLPAFVSTACSSGGFQLVLNEGVYLNSSTFQGVRIPNKHARAYQNADGTEPLATKAHSGSTQRENRMRPRNTDPISDNH